MPDPTIVPTTIAALIHLPSIRDAGSGWVSMLMLWSVMRVRFAPPGRVGNPSPWA
jgi:hypothetical protein